MRAKLLKYLQKESNSRINLILIVVAVAIIGVLTLVFSRAESPSVSINADTGSITSPAMVQNDSSASDGKSVVFGNTGSGATPTATATLITTQCIPVWVSGNQMIYNLQNSAGIWNPYIGDTNCQNGQQLIAPTGGNIGASDVTPDGRYVILEEAFGITKSDPSSAPGSGAGDQLVLLDRQTGKITQMTSGGWGTIWARLNSTGTMVTWAQLMTPPELTGDIFNQPFGYWQIDVADITSDGTLSNERSYSQSSSPGFYETYGFYGNDVLFASDVGVSPVSSLGAWMSTQDWMINDSLSSGTIPTRISPTYTSSSGTVSNTYHEFMYQAPSGTFDDSGPWILGSMSYGTDGLDLWRFKADGSDQQQLTYFNGTITSQGVQSVPGFGTATYSIVGGIAIDPSNPKIIYAAVSHSSSIDSTQLWKIQVSP
jgi:hypothetical protein